MEGVTPVSVDISVLAAIGRQAGLCAVGFCRAEPFARTAQTLRDRKEAGLHGGMQFTYRNPDRSTDPARLVPGAAALVVGALEFNAETCDPPDDGSPYARVAAYAQADYYTPLRTALETIAEVLRAEGHRAVVSADENGLVDRAAAHRAAIGWWGKNSNILVPGSGSLVVLGAVVTDAPIVPADPDPGVAGRMRIVPAVPGRLPDGSHRRSRHRGRPPLSGMAGANRRSVRPGLSRPRSGTASTAATTAQRCAPRTGCASGWEPAPTRRRIPRIPRREPTPTRPRIPRRGCRFWICSTPQTQI